MVLGWDGVRKSQWFGPAAALGSRGMKTAAATTLRLSQVVRYGFALPSCWLQSHHQHKNQQTHCALCPLLSCLSPRARRASGLIPSCPIAFWPWIPTGTPVRLFLITWTIPAEFCASLNMTQPYNIPTPQTGPQNLPGYVIRYHQNSLLFKSHL